MWKDCFIVLFAVVVCGCCCICCIVAIVVVCDVSLRNNVDVII